MTEPLAAGSRMRGIVVHLLQPLSVLQGATLPTLRFAQPSQHGDSRIQAPHRWDVGWGCWSPIASRAGAGASSLCKLCGGNALCPPPPQLRVLGAHFSPTRCAKGCSLAASLEKFIFPFF